MSAIVVVGGGIAGASVAAHVAAETDRPVTVYDRGDLAGETTAKSAAFFGYYGTGVERRMKRYGMARYNEFFVDSRGDPYYDLVGRLRVATTPDGARELDERVSTTRSDLRDAVGYVPGGVLRESLLLPELDAAAVEGATYRPHVGYFEPRELAGEFVARARENGATFEPHTPVEDVVVADGRVTGVVVDGERVAAGAVVCAAGPWNPAVARLAGIDLPVCHSLAPILELERPGGGHTLPIVQHEESGVYVRGGRDGTVLVGRYPLDGGTEEIDPDGVPDRVSDETRDELWRVVEDLLPGLADAAVADEWVGVRSHTPDGNPIVGWTAVEGFSVVAFNSSGIQLAPAAGRVVAQQLVHGRPTSYYDAVSVTRFDGHGDASYSVDG